MSQTATITDRPVRQLLPIVCGVPSCTKTGCGCIACPPNPQVTPHVGGHCNSCGNGCHRTCGP